MPGSLTAAVETPEVLGYGTDADVDAGSGARMVPGVWTARDDLTDDELDRARKWLRAQAEQADPDRFVQVPASAVRQWLGTFIVGAAKQKMTANDIGMRVETLVVAVGDRDDRWFTPETMRAAWKRFKWIPDAHELMEFFDELEAEERVRASRLLQSIDATERRRSAKPERRVQAGEDPRQASGWGWKSEAERLDHEAYLREERDRERRELAAIARKAAAADGLELPPVLEPAPLETPREFAARVREQTDAFLDAETKAMRRGGRGTGGRLKPSSPAQIAEALKVLKGRAPVPRPDIEARARVEEPEPAPEVSP